MSITEYNARLEIGVIVDEQELLFHKLLDENPFDQQTRLVLADYMEEHPTKVKCRNCNGAGFVGTVSLKSVMGDFEAIRTGKIIHPWQKPNSHGEMPGGICCQRAVGGVCYEHDQANYKDHPISTSVVCPACNGDKERPDDRRARMVSGYRAMAHLNLSPEKVAPDMWVWYDNNPGPGFCPMAWYAVISAARVPRGMSHGTESSMFKSRMAADEALAECWLEIDDVTRASLLEVGYKSQLGQDGLPLDMGLTVPGILDGEPVSADHPMDPAVENGLKNLSRRWNMRPG